MAFSKSFRECAAEICVRLRALPCGTTGMAEVKGVHALLQHCVGELRGERGVAPAQRNR